MNEILLILGMTLVTFGVRYPVLALVGRMQLPEPVTRALKYVPPAVLTAIIFPLMFLQEGALFISPDNAYLIAGIASIVIAWRTRNLLLTILLGMVIFLVWRVLTDGLSL
ncbi:MAG: AzlD domain-containing protein [bacterium]|nr:AzlD domain-containing protein [bacterium]